MQDADADFGQLPTYHAPLAFAEGGTESNDPVEDDVNRDGMGELGNAPRHFPGEQPLEPELE